MASSLTRASQNMAIGFPDGIPWYWPSQKWVFQNRQKLHGLFRPSLRSHFGNNFTGYKLITESSQDSWKGKVESQIHGWHLASSHCKRAIFAALFGKIQSFTVGTLVTTVHIPPTYKTTLPLPQDPQRLILKVFKVCLLFLVERHWVGKSKIRFKKLRKLARWLTSIWFPYVKELDFSFHFSDGTIMWLGLRDENV